MLGILPPGNLIIEVRQFPPHLVGSRAGLDVHGDGVRLCSAVGKGYDVSYRLGEVLHHARTRGHIGNVVAGYNGHKLGYIRTVGHYDGYCAVGLIYAAGYAVYAETGYTVNGSGLGFPFAGERHIARGHGEGEVIYLLGFTSFHGKRIGKRACNQLHPRVRSCGNGYGIACTGSSLAGSQRAALGRGYGYLEFARLLRAAAECMYIHLQKRQMHVEPVIDTEHFIICPNRFVRYPEAFQKHDCLLIGETLWTQSNQEKFGYFNRPKEKLLNVYRDFRRLLYEPNKIDSLLYRNKKGNDQK